MKKFDLENLGRLKALVAKGKSGQALSELLGLFPDQESEISLLQARWNEIEQQINGDVLTFEEKRIGKNRVNHSIICSIDKFFNENENEYSALPSLSTINRKFAFILTSLGFACLVLGFVFLQPNAGVHLSKVEPQTCFSFDSLCERNILLAEIKPYQGLTPDSQVHDPVENLIADRIDYVISEHNLLNVCPDIDLCDSANLASMTFVERRKIAEEHDINLLLWGKYYSSQKTDSLLINLSYYAIHEYDPYKQSTISRNTGLRRIRQSLKKIPVMEEGELTATIQEIVLWALALTYFSDGKFELTLEVLGKMKPETNEQKAIVNQAIAEVYDAMGKGKKALEYYGIALRYFSMNAKALNNYGVLLCQSGDTKAARLAFEQAEKASKDENGSLLIEADEYGVIIKNLEEIFGIQKEEKEKVAAFIEPILPIKSRTSARIKPKDCKIRTKKRYGLKKWHNSRHVQRSNNINPRKTYKVNAILPKTEKHPYMFQVKGEGARLGWIEYKADMWVDRKCNCKL